MKTRCVSGMAPLALLAALGLAGAARAQLTGIVAEDAKPALVQRGFEFTEGPVGAPDGGLYFTDVRANRIHRMTPDGKVQVLLENSRGANGLALDRMGRLIAAEGESGRIVAIAPGGMVTPLATGYQGQRFVRPNDLVLDRKGGIYFTDPGPRPMPGDPPGRRPHVYYLRPDGDVIRLETRINRPNGITLSLDEKTLLVADSMGENVLAFDVQADGSVRNQRPFARLRDVQREATGVRSGADGMAVDREGRLYVTSNSGIQVFDPKGSYLGTIPVPNKPSNLAFGGKDRKSLFITAGASLFRLETLTSGPPDRAK